MRAESRAEPPRPPYFFVFDVESVGLHGDGFAVGYVIIAAVDGAEVSSGLAWSNPDNVRQGDVHDREWVKNHVPTLPHERRVLSARELREWFWGAWQSAADEGAWLVADCPWPVEARFLHDCIGDDPGPRQWKGPYPLIDVASVRMAKGLNPLGSEERFSNELPMHNPLADARQSARLLLEALRV